MPIPHNPAPHSPFPIAQPGFGDASPEEVGGRAIVLRGEAVPPVHHPLPPTIRVVGREELGYHDGSVIAQARRPPQPTHPLPPTIRVVGREELGVHEGSVQVRRGQARRATPPSVHAGRLEEWPPAPGEAIVLRGRATPPPSHPRRPGPVVASVEEFPPHPGSAIVLRRERSQQNVFTLSVQSGLGLRPSDSEQHAYALSVLASIGLKATATSRLGSAITLGVQTTLEVRAAVGYTYVTPIRESLSVGLGVRATAAAYVSPIVLSVQTGIGFRAQYAAEDPFELATPLNLHAAASAYVSPIRLSVSSGLGLGAAATTGAARLFVLSVSSTFGLQPAASSASARVFTLSVSAGLGLEPAPSSADQHLIDLVVSTTLGLRPAAVVAADRIYSVSVSASLGLQPAASLAGVTSVRVLSVGSGLGLRPSVAGLDGTWELAVSAGLGLQPAASLVAVHAFAVSSGLGLSAAATVGRDVTLAVSAGLGLSAAAAQVGQAIPLAVSSTLGVQPGAPALVAGPDAVSTSLGFGCAIVLEHLSPMGLPGGPGAVLLSGLSGSYPFTYAETPAGVVLLANGVDPMIRWQMGVADVAGVIPPAAAPLGAAAGLGPITGTRLLFARFLDVYGNPSNLSPAGMVQCGTDRSIDDITWSATSGIVTVQVLDHGFVTGQDVMIQGVVGLPMDGTYPVTVIDQDHFIPSGLSLTSGSWTGGGSVSTGSASITYSRVPQPTQAKVAAIQLLRNLEGSLDVLYVDATLAPGTAAFESLSTDDGLAQGEPVVLRSDDGMPLGMRYAVPPANRPYLINYLGRIFAAGDVDYTLGNVQVTSGSTVIQGWGTQWPATLSGRSIYVRGATSGYAIASLDSSSQVASLGTPFSSSSSPFATYSIRSSPSDRKLLQWSEPDLPEAWPAWNALAIPEDNDEITGLFVRGSYLYVAERRHLWRFQFQGDPATGGHAFLQAHRGAINHRCVANADDAAFILDEVGVYAFTEAGAEPIDQDVQAVFWQDGLGPSFQVDWSQDRRLWHAAVDRLRTTVRWFVHVVGVSGLTTALCYNYRLRRWWWEQYPVRVTSSCEGTLAEAANAIPAPGYRRSLAGAECRTVLAVGLGALDLVGGDGTLRGTVGSATSTTLTDPGAAFSASAVGGRVAIVDGVAAGQSAIISGVTATTLTTVGSWDPAPQPGDAYQVGGIPWGWRSGWLDVEDEEGDTTRDMIVAFQSLVDPATMSVDIYYDHSSTPVSWGYGQDFDGVRVVAGQPGVQVDMTSVDVLPGYRVFRIARHSERYAYSDRYIQVQLGGVQNDETVRVYQISLRGVDQEGV